MLEKKNLKKALNDFGTDVVSRSKRNFRAKSASGRGINSVDFDLDIFKNSFALEFSMEDYMVFQDKGVSGKKRKFNTPFRYTNKRPPARVFDRWSIRRGLAPRDKQGKFLSRKSLGFALATHIFNQGIKPTLFFTKAFNAEFKNLPEELVEAYGLDVDKFLKSTT